MAIHPGLRTETLGGYTIIRCPICNHPLSQFFTDIPTATDGVREIGVSVGCSRCCWFENWGVIRDAEVKNAS